MSHGNSAGLSTSRLYMDQIPSRHRSLTPRGSKLSSVSAQRDSLQGLERSLREAKQLLPTLVEIVTTGERAAQQMLRERLKSSSDILETWSQQTQDLSSQKLSSTDLALAASLRTEHSALTESAIKLERYASLLFSGDGLAQLESIPALSRHDQRELFGALPGLRERFWHEVYSAPFVMSERMEQLSLLSQGGSLGRRGLFRARWDNRDAAAHKQEASETVAMYDRLLRKYGEPLPRDLRMAVAKRLSALPELPEDILLRGAELERKLLWLLSRENFATALHPSTSLDGTQGAAELKELQKLREEVGGEGVDASILLSSLLVTRQPYIRLKNFLFLTNKSLMYSEGKVTYREFARMPDLSQGAAIGLMKAIERFDLSSGYEFSTCAHAWLRQSTGDARRVLGPVVLVPAHMTTPYLALKTAAENPRDHALRARVSEEHKVDIKTIESLSRIGSLWFSVENSQGETPTSETVAISSTLFDPHTVPNAAPDFDAEDLAKVRHALSSLSEREQEIVASRFGLGHRETLSLRELAARYGLSKERIRQIELRALKLLRKALGVPGDRSS